MTVVAEHRIRLPRALPHQVECLQDEHRFKVIRAGRRWGKTTMGLKMVLEGHGDWVGALDGGRIWWLAPVYSQATYIWAQLKNATRGAWSRKLEQDRTIEFANGGSVSVKSTDNPDLLRGTGLDGVVLDECAFMRANTWTEVIRPALMDRGGWAVFISTPKGLNWFYDLWQHAQDADEWELWHQPTWANALIPPEEIEAIRGDPEMSPLQFRQEVEAEFVSGGAGMFMDQWFKYWEMTSDEHGDLYVLDARRFYTHQVRRFTTSDLAVSLSDVANYTVASTWGVTPDNDLIWLDMTRKRLEGPDQLPMLWEVFRTWSPAYVGIEKVGYQLALIQQASREGLPVKELRPEKDKISRALTAQAYMEKGKVWIPRHAGWRGDVEEEILSFPEGKHDDIVDTLSYAAAEVARAHFAQPVAAQGIRQANPWTIR